MYGGRSLHGRRTLFDRAVWLSIDVYDAAFNAERTRVAVAV
jgi:hypothetical protein